MGHGSRRKTLGTRVFVQFCFNQFNRVILGAFCWTPVFRWAKKALQSQVTVAQMQEFKQDFVDVDFNKDPFGM